MARTMTKSQKCSTYFVLWLISGELRTHYKVIHPENSDANISYIYGIIVTDGKDGHNEEVTTNFTLYADNAVYYS